MHDDSGAVPTTCYEENGTNKAAVSIIGLIEDAWEMVFSWFSARIRTSGKRQQFIHRPLVIGVTTILDCFHSARRFNQHLGR